MFVYTRLKWQPTKRLHQRHGYRDLPPRQLLLFLTICVWVKRLHKFREFIISDAAMEELAEMDNGHRKKCLFELKKIKEAIDFILKNTNGQYC